MIYLPTGMGYVETSLIPNAKINFSWTEVLNFINKANQKKSLNTVEKYI